MHMKRITALLLTVVMLLSMLTIFIQAAGSEEEALGEIHIYNGGETLSCLAVNSRVQTLNYVYYQYPSTQGYTKEIPAYCVNPTDDGVPQKVGVGESIKYIAAERASEPQVMGIVANGFPTKSLGELGLQSKVEGYYATKIALWCYIIPTWSIDAVTVNPNLSGEARTQAERVLAAAKQIYQYGTWWSEIPSASLTTSADRELAYRAVKSVLQDVYALDEEHAEAVRKLEQLWAEGYTVAAHQMGKFYRDDLSTMREHEKAEWWFRLSADAGNDFSEYALGKLLLSRKRTAEAVRWLDKAAGHGNQFAQYRLGKLYLTDESVTKDVEKALDYLTAAAGQGNSFAQYTLGKLYLLGRDVGQDREQAKEWFTRSADQGNQYAKFFLDRFDQFRDPSVMLAATKLLHHMGRIFRDNSVPPHNPAGIRIDSKRRRYLMEKRLALGHKADDHEEQEISPTMQN